MNAFQSLYDTKHSSGLLVWSCLAEVAGEEGRRTMVAIQVLRHLLPPGADTAAGDGPWAETIAKGRCRHNRSTVDDINRALPIRRSIP